LPGVILKICILGDRVLASAERDGGSDGIALAQVSWLKHGFHVLCCDRLQQVSGSIGGAIVYNDNFFFPAMYQVGFLHSFENFEDCIFFVINADYYGEFHGYGHFL